MRAVNTGMIILGGGLIKHHICNANLMVGEREQGKQGERERERERGSSAFHKAKSSLGKAECDLACIWVMFINIRLL